LIIIDFYIKLINILTVWVNHNHKI